MRLVYAFGPLPALIAAFLFTGGMRAIPVVLDGTAGSPVIAGTTFTLVILSLGYIAALRRPPGAQVLVAAIGLTIFMQLLSPVLFSADIYAYAFYGDEALHGLNPYAYDPGTMNDPLSAIAKHAWNGSIPRCVYGPVAVLLAAIADVAGAPGGPAAQIALQRVVAVAAFAACVALVFRIFPDARARVAIALNPVVIAAVVEGHNDAAMLALLLAACAWPQAKRRFFILATLVKAPALFFIAALRRDALTWAALAVVCIGYLPLLWGVLGHAASHGTPADWDSPLGLIALGTGRPAAAALGLIAIGATAYFVRRLRGAERSAAFAFVLWYLLPNAYPWYALWIVPLAARDMRSPWSQGLIAAALFAPVRTLTDAIVPNGSALHGQMIALQYLPPLLVRLASLLRRPALAAGTAALVVFAMPGIAGAQTAPPAGPVTPAPLPQPAPSPTATPTPVPVPTATTTPSPPPTAAPTPDPYTYVVPAPAAPPGDGPQIIDVSLSDRNVHAGGSLLVRVRTSPNVVGVEARAMGRFLPIPQSAPGMFLLSGSVPGGLPFFLYGRKDIVFAAATADGRQATLTVPITLVR